MADEIPVHEQQAAKTVAQAVAAAKAQVKAVNDAANNVQQPEPPAKSEDE